MDNAQAKNPQTAKTTSIAQHGIALEIFGKGIVIIGKSGVGKSELGIELIDRGHRLICDDLVQGTLSDNQVMLSSPHQFGIGFMEVRGVGFINAEHFFGKHCICHKELPLFIIIQLVGYDALDVINQDRLKQLITKTRILGNKYDVYQLPVGANRNLPILVELIVKYAIAKEQGYDSHQAFIHGQFNFIQSGEE
jgi:HPr kinase/phosphorylase